MEKQVKTQKMIRQRRFMLVLPLLALPFMTLIFWSLGGGKMEKAEAQSAKQTGFNIKLPDANLKDEKPMDKMNYYDQAKLDSLKFQELVKNDPHYRNMDLSDSAGISNGTFSGSSARKGLNTSLYSGGSNDPNAEKIYSKLAELDREMKNPAHINTETATYTSINPIGKGRVPVNSGDVSRLEQMMQAMSQSDGQDPEMQQLNGMLEKILDIQHPDLVQEKLRKNSESKRGQVFAVSGKGKEDRISLLQTNTETSTANGFYSLDDNSVTNESQNAIQAVIHETQTIVNGSTIKLRLINDVFINGVHIPKDNFLFGTASLNGERLGVKINSVRYNNSLFPVELSVYDMDGLDGIYIPGAITRDVAKQSADRSMQTIGMTSLDPSWGAQAAGAGIEAAKTLFSKKVKLVKVTVKAGYQVLLRDEKQKQNQSN
ncbi:conjugative transposon protein TraM [Pedobacter sp. ISL-68]|uniref:conjugative transposon protein TraM n=1 Tax=Pedobacter sp. ISL-68 TaxID=2819165 RepID=UPI001BEC7CB8|nr:conjugative transposon protein TraM [Pedobacter sp. ISL-68]MBT2591404.1 conjugative transposon protein TraM [Pedobacter sp. ISL-68]